MKRFITIVAFVLISLILTASASAANDPRVPALQRKVNALSSKIATLQNQVNQNAAVLNHEIDLSQCSFVYQSHFNYGVLNLFATLIGAAPIADRSPSDNGACSRVGITPPSFLSVNRSPFSSLIGIMASMSR